MLVLCMPLPCINHLDQKRQNELCFPPECDPRHGEMGIERLVHSEAVRVKDGGEKKRFSGQPYVRH